MVSSESAEDGIINLETVRTVNITNTDRLLQLTNSFYLH